MLPGMNPRQMSQVMKQMGISTQDISAKRVIIETENEKIIINEPQVVKMNMQGQDMYQVVGGEETLEGQALPEDDVKMVMEQASASKEEAEAALKAADGDIAQAILKLSKE